MTAPGADYVEGLDSLVTEWKYARAAWEVHGSQAAHERLVAAEAALFARSTDTRSEQLRNIVMSYDAANPMRSADSHGGNCRCHRCDIDRIRAIIGGQANE